MTDFQKISSKDHSKPLLPVREAAPTAPPRGPAGTARPAARQPQRPTPVVLKTKELGGQRTVSGRRGQPAPSLEGLQPHLESGRPQGQRTGVGPAQTAPA